MADSSFSPLHLEVFRNGERITEVHRAEESVTIGSGEDALLSLDGAGVGALHAVINRGEDGSVYLLDLGTDGGTRVNGAPVASNIALGSGDAIEIGELKIVVRFADPDPFEDDVATVVTAGEAPDHADEDFSGDEHVADEIAAEAASAGVLSLAEETADGPLGEAADEGEFPMPPPLAPRVPQPEGGFRDREDVLAFILRSTGTPPHPTEKNRPKFLEVNQIWSDTLLDTKHFALEGAGVTVGSSLGYKWNVLGVDLGWVPGPLRFLVRYAPPVLSEIDSDWRSDFYAPDDHLPDGHDHRLFVWQGDRYVARISPSWGGYVETEAGQVPLSGLVAAGLATEAGAVVELPMDEGRRLLVDIDGVSFFSHVVNGARRTDRAADVDYLFVALLCILGTMGGVFGGIMWFAPPDVSTDVADIPDRFVELVLETPPPEEKEQKKPDGNPDAGEGEKAKKEEGKVGKKDATMERAKGNKVEVAQQEVDRQVAESAGILGALSSDPGMAGFGAAGLSSDLTGGIGGLIGAKGTQIGSGGLGSRGSGLGGGGNAEGLGGLGTKGVGSGASGYGSGGGNLGTKGEGGIGRIGGDPIILGALDRSLIDEVIKRHMNQIRYCYQRELTRDPALAGKIVVRFTIAGDGSVSASSIKETTMNNSAVETCVTGRFMRMQFPEPRGGGVVIVSYPFLFSPG